MNMKFKIIQSISVLSSNGNFILSIKNHYERCTNYDLINAWFCTACALHC